MTAIREQDHGGSLGVVGEMRCALFHRFDVVRVDADGILEVGAQAPAIGRADGPQAISEGRDGLRVVQQMQVGATLDIPRFRSELDKRDRGVARDEIGGQCINAVGHPFECTREARAVPGVVEDGRREVEAEDDVGAVGRCLSGQSRSHAARSEKQAGDGNGDSDETRCPMKPCHNVHVQETTWLLAHETAMARRSGPLLTLRVCFAVGL